MTNLIGRERVGVGGAAVSALLVQCCGTHVGRQDNTAGALTRRVGGRLRGRL